MRSPETRHHRCNGQLTGLGRDLLGLIKVQRSRSAGCGHPSEMSLSHGTERSGEALLARRASRPRVVAPQRRRFGGVAQGLLDRPRPPRRHPAGRERPGRTRRSRHRSTRHSRSFSSPIARPWRSRGPRPASKCGGVAPQFALSYADASRAAAGDCSGHPTVIEPWYRGLIPTCHANRPPCNSAFRFHRIRFFCPLGQPSLGVPPRPKTGGPGLTPGPSFCVETTTCSHLFSCRRKR